jgi:CheY-like chemotaxis protein
MNAASLPVGEDDDHARSPGSPAEVLVDPRILVLDADLSIHDGLRQALAFDDDAGAGDRSLFTHFHIDSVADGDDAAARVKQALVEGRPYAVAFVELLVPPRGDGIDIVRQLWHDDPDLQIGLCTALADPAQAAVVREIGPADGLLVLRMPFEPIEIRQMVHALSSKWMLNRELTIRLGQGSRRAQAGPPPEPIAEVAGPSESSPPDATGPADGRVRGLRSLALAFKHLGGLLESYRRIVLEVSALPGQEHLLRKMEQAEQSANLAGLQREVPRAFERLARGTRPVAGRRAAAKEVFHQHATAPPSQAAEAAAAPRRHRDFPSPRRR